jgi:uncharacterized membrane-anchored protein YitT (DUF2179 family)
MNAATRSVVRDYLVLIAGTLIFTAAFAFFLVPAKISSGGVSGLAIVAHYLWGLPTGAVVFVLNVPLLVIGYIYLGGLRFTVRTLLTHDAFLATLYGGVISGVGVGLVFGTGASTGGSTIISRLLQNFVRTSIGIIQLSVDAVVVIISGLVFGPQLALYSLVGLFVSGKAIDWTLEGLSGERVALIVTKSCDVISVRITHDLGRGVTVLEGRGGYTGEARPVILCVIDRSEEPILRALVQGIDPAAFVVVTAATTVLGEGFAPLDSARTPRKRLFKSGRGSA